MKRLVLLLLTVFSGLAAGTYREGKNMRVLSRLVYRNSSQGCEYASEGCAPLSDIWALSSGAREVALVGLSNGLSVVDVTEPEAPSQVAFFRGCLTEWRDVKCLGSTCFMVNDRSGMCECDREDLRCERYVELEGGRKVPATQGSITTPLGADTLSLEYAVAEPYLACSPLSNAPSLAGKAVLVGRGECEFATKIKAVQAAGGKAVLLVNYRDDTVQPAMQGDGTGIEIPGVSIDLTEGEQLRAAGSGIVRLSDSFVRVSPRDLYQRPEGLVVFDMSDVLNPKKSFATRKHFTYSHNLYTSGDRLYACGNDAEKGLVVLDENAVEVGRWSDYYVHDLVVHGGKIYVACIYDKLVKILDENTLASVGGFATARFPHNIAIHETALYLSHEDSGMPVTIWKLSETSAQATSNISMGAERLAIPHNAFVSVIDEQPYLWLSYYSEGVLAYDIRRPFSPVLHASYDTSVYETGFRGVWGVYPFSALRPTAAFASDIEEGLIILEMTPAEPDREVVLELRAVANVGSLLYFLVAGCLGVAVAIGGFVAMRCCVAKK